ncbi:MAG TPA: ribosome maturation factor RimP [Mycobacteriales bacterium]|nr:ribosome maturation factor RimP [Mycobacteriales bacterium]
MTTAAIRERLRALLEPVVAAAGMDLEGLTVTPAGRRRVLRVVVDADGGVSLDDIAALSTALSEVLDDSAVTSGDPMGGDPMSGGAYTLEVTSPGVDRPLVEPRHWRRATGRLVHAALAGGGELRGRVLAVDADGVVFDVGTRHVRHGFGALGRGRVQVEFRRPDGGAAGDEAGEADARADAGGDPSGDPEEPA